MAAVTTEAATNGTPKIQASSTLTDALARATRADLQEIEDKLELLEGELDSLRAIKRVLQIRFGLRTRNGCKTKKSAALASLPGRGDVTEKARIDMAKYVLHNGPSKAKTLQEQLGISNTTFYKAVEHPWFENNGGTVNITNDARREIKP